MDFDLTEEQSAVQTGIDSIVERHKAVPQLKEQAHWLANERLEQELAEGGYFEVARQEGLGTLGAVLLTEAIARLPWCVEVGATSIVGARVSAQLLPRPLSLARTLRGQAVRFLAPGGTLLVDMGSEVRQVDLSQVEVKAVDAAPLAYPYGRIDAAAVDRAPVLKGVSAGQLRQWWQVSLGAEITGAMQASMDLTLEYIKARKQFGRALGSFQAVQHRMAESAMYVQSARLLVRKAALSDAPADAAFAASYAQEAAMQIVYNVHQFHGAMGLTMEYPLHYWTQRLRALHGEAGGPSAIAGSAASLVWA